MNARAKYNKLVADFVKESRDILDRYLRKEISTDTWNELTTTLVRSYHVRAANLGREHFTGVEDALSLSDFSIGEQLSLSQVSYLSDFASVIDDYTKDEAVRRLLLYQFNLRGTANTSWLVQLQETETRWVTTANESCVDCLYNASLGYLPASKWPISPGSIGLECAMNCKCYFRLRNGKTGLKYVQHE